MSPTLTHKSRSVSQHLKSAVYVRATRPDAVYLLPDDSYYYDNLYNRPDVARALANAHINPVVCAVLYWITKQTRNTPFELFLEPPSGDRSEVPRHPMLDILIEPNPYMSGREILSVSIWNMVLDGQFFWHKDRDGTGAVAGLTFLSSHHVRVKGTPEELITHYEYRPGGQRAPILYDVDDVVHVRIDPNPSDPKNGISPLVCLADDLLIDTDAAGYTQGFLSEMGSAGGFLMPPQAEGVISPEVAKATRDYIDKEFRGRRRGGLGVLRAFMNYVRTSVDPETVGMKNIKDDVVERICGVLGVHPVIVGLGAGTTQSRVGAATKELERAAWANGIIPLQDTIAEQIERQLLPDFEPENPRDYTLTYDRSGIMSLQPDLLREAQRASINVKAGIITQAEGRLDQGYEADERHDFFLYPTGITPTRPGELPAQPEPEPEADERPEEPDGEERDRDASRLRKLVLSKARSKATFNEEQRLVIAALAQDYDELMPQFTDELDEVFQALGDRAVTAFWETEGTDAALEAAAIVRVAAARMNALGAAYLDDPPTVWTNGNGHEKQSEEEVLRQANRVLAAMSMHEWEVEVMSPLWTGGVARTLNATIGTISATLQLGFTLPDTVTDRIIREGGTRLGLVDFTAQTRQSLFEAIHTARQAGGGPIEIARKIRDLVPPGPFVKAGSKYRAELIARTETAYAQNRSAIEMYKASDVFVGVLVSDGDAHEPCASVDGQRLTFAEADNIGEIAHPNCTRSFAPVRELR